MSQTVFSLESIPLRDRASFLASRRPNLQSREWTGKSGSLRMQVSLSTEHTRHPGFTGVFERTFGLVYAYDLKLLEHYRVGSVKPPGIARDTDPSLYAALPGDFWEYCDRAAKIEERLANLGVGKAKIGLIDKRIETRLPPGGGPPWMYYANERFLNRDEQKELSRAVSEWCDGDTVVAHIAHSLDVICSKDRNKGRKTGSVFSSDIRKALATEFGLVVESPEELAKRLR